MQLPTYGMEKWHQMYLTKIFSTHKINEIQYVETTSSN